MWFASHVRVEGSIPASVCLCEVCAAQDLAPPPSSGPELRPFSLKGNSLNRACAVWLEWVQSG